LSRQGPKATFRVGTRGSRLAMAQTQIVTSTLSRLYPNANFEIVTISTKGDVDKRPLFTMDEKGIFEKEVNEAVVNGSVDFAVHSLKDVPSNLASELVVASIPKRARPNDVLVNGRGLNLHEMASGSIIGTSSLRRAVQVMHSRPDLIVKPIRGNVETRVKKVISGEYDAAILAEAGLSRLGMKDMIAERFDMREFVPAPGQGAIAIVCKKQRKDLIRTLQYIEDPKSRAEVSAERSLLDKMEGGCRFPIGAIALSSEHSMTIYASVSSSDGKQFVRIRSTGPADKPERLGIVAADKLIDRGAMELAVGWRTAVEEWNRKL
jgi:hydroxymethylbilane synthase